MAKPLLNLHGQHEPYCEYPTMLKVAMDDGTVQTYVLENKTQYQFDNVMKCVNRIKIGYECGYPARKRNRLHRSQL